MSALEMPEPYMIPDLPTEIGPLGLCLACLGERNEAIKKRMPVPEVRQAIANVPSLQTMEIAGQTIASIVVVGSCNDHMQTREKSAEEIASEHGLYYGRAGEMP